MLSSTQRNQTYLTSIMKFHHFIGKLIGIQIFLKNLILGQDCLDDLEEIERFMMNLNGISLTFPILESSQNGTFIEIHILLQPGDIVFIFLGMSYNHLDLLDKLDHILLSPKDISRPLGEFFDGDINSTTISILFGNIRIFNQNHRKEISPSYWNLRIIAFGYNGAGLKLGSVFLAVT